MAYTDDFPGCRSWCRDHLDDLDVCRMLMCHPAADVRISISQSWTLGSWSQPVVYVGSLFAIADHPPASTEPRHVRGMAELMRAVGADQLADHLRVVADRFEEILAQEPART